MFECRYVSGAISTPATAPTAEPTIHAVEVSLRMLRPITAAPNRFCGMARNASPVRVQRRYAASARAMTSEVTMMPKCWEDTTMPAKRTAPSPKIDGYGRTSGPQMAPTPPCSTKYRPSVTTTVASNPLVCTGRITIRSIAPPRIAPAMMLHRTATGNGAPTLWNTVKPTNAATAATSPCAKLATSVMRLMNTSPTARSA